MNSLLRRGVLVLGELVVVLSLSRSDRSILEASSRSPPFLLWWLVLFLEALVLSPNIEREGRQERPIRKGTASTAYPDKSGLRLPKTLVVMLSWAPR